MDTLKKKWEDMYKEHKTYIHIGLAAIAIIIGWKMFKK